jgi:hypothetical protein
VVTFNFILFGQTPQMLAGFEKSAFSDLSPADLIDGQDMSVLQPYLLIKSRMQGCRVSGEFDPDAVNIATGQHLLRPAKGRPFVVSVRNDFPRRRWVNLEFVHNKAQLGPNAFWVPHAPQLGLIPRDPARGETFATVGYMGRPVNFVRFRGLWQAGFGTISEEIENLCASLNLKLVMRGADTWHDYSDLDVVLGIRDFSGRPFHNKPAVKLVNSWIAGTPFIGGPDSGYLDVGEPYWNYLRVSTAGDLARALELLRKDPALRARLVERGKEAVMHYGFEETAQRWITLLNGPVKEAFLARRHAALGRFSAS